MIEALRERSFRWYIGGLAAYSLAQTMNRFLLPWLAYETSGSPFVVGLVGLALSGPPLFFAPLGGVWADRVDRVRLLRSTQLLNATVFAGFAVVVALGGASVPAILLAAVASALILSFDQPTRQALLPALVPPRSLTAVYGATASIWNVSGIVGPALSATLLALLGAGARGAAPLFVLSSLGSAFMIFALTRVRVPARAPREPDRWWREFNAGIRYVATTPMIRELAALAFAGSLFATSAVFLMPAFVAEAYGRDVTAVGLLVSAWSAGALLGAVSVGAGAWQRSRGLVVLSLAAAYGVGMIVFAFVRTFEVALVVLVLAGIAGAVYVTVAHALVQVLVAEQVRGRVMGIFALNYVSSPLGATLLGAVASVTSVATAVALGGVILTVVAVGLAVAARRLARID